MVSFIKSKGTSIINKPIGIVSVNTGEEQLYEQITQSANQLTNSALASAKQMEIQKGKDFGMSIQTRDANGFLQVEKTPDTFSDIAKQSAQNELNKIYANELSNDVNLQLTKARADSKGDLETFQKLASAYLGEI